ncbi:MAG: sulfurtransferase complex subunit TusC [Pseudomonadales bacterium]
MQPSQKTILFVLQRSPYGSTATQETLDAALAAAAFEQNVQLLFSGDGVWSLLPDQHSELIDRKNIEKLLHALEYYNIHSVYVDQQSLDERQLTAQQLSITVTPLQAEQIPAIFQHADCVVAL